MRRLPFQRFRLIDGPGARSGTSADRLNQIMRSLPEIVGGPGITVTRQGNRLVVGLLNPPVLPITAFWARIAGSAQNGPNRWEYQVEEVLKTGPGYQGVSARPNGIAGSAFNTFEHINSAEGVQGNGVDLEDLPEGFGIGPIPDGVPVLCQRWRRSDTTCPMELWFSAVNPVVGRCPPGA